MNLIAVTAPGRFPTVVHDPGRWWSALEGESGFTLLRVSANAAWWRVLCSRRFAHSAGGSRARRLVRLMRGIDLESISPRTLRRMDKYVEGLDAPVIATLFRLHVNLIAAFPGETLAELIESVAFLSQCLAVLTGATCQFNKFTLFAAAPIMRDPAEFGVLPVPAPGDMPTHYCYQVPFDRVANAIAIERQLPELRARLHAALGWNRFDDGPGPAAAIELYFGTGHSAIIKALARNPFANPLGQSTALAQSARQEYCT
jgi:hypothetical protein